MNPFEHVAFHLDLKIQVMPQAALLELTRDLARSGYTMLIVEWEGAFPYRRHAILSSKYAYTEREVKEFVRVAHSEGIEVVPLQQCFGHVEYILRHPRYRHLRESQVDLCQLCPAKKDEALRLFAEVFEDLEEFHQSKYIHIGGDETYLLGHCSVCRKNAAGNGYSQIYVEYIAEVIELLSKKAMRPMLWADMVLQYPEAISQIPKETILVDWNYGWKPNHYGDLSRIQDFEIWGAAALRSSPDNHSLCDWAKHWGNLRDFIPQAKENDYRGMILTSWSTSGQYGYDWDALGEPSELFPLRRVYPLNGFRIFSHAFVAAIHAEQPLNVEEFIRAYARTQFALDARECISFSKCLMSSMPFLRDTALAEEIRKELRKALTVRNALKKIRPKKSIREFSHFVLMAELRLCRLQFQLVEAAVQSSDFRAINRSGYLGKLARIMGTMKECDASFIELNRGYLYDEELEEEIRYRWAKIRSLYERLARSGRGPISRRITSPD